MYSYMKGIHGERLNLTRACYGPLFQNACLTRSVPGLVLVFLVTATLTVLMNVSTKNLTVDLQESVHHPAKPVTILLSIGVQVFCKL